MKIQVDESDSVIEIITLPKGDIRLTLGTLGGTCASVSMTPRDAQVIIAALEAARDETL